MRLLNMPGPVQVSAEWMNLPEIETTFSFDGIKSVTDLDVGGVHQPWEIDRSRLATGPGALGSRMLRSLLCISLRHSIISFT